MCTPTPDDRLIRRAKLLHAAAALAAALAAVLTLAPQPIGHALAQAPGGGPPTPRLAATQPVATGDASMQPRHRSFVMLNKITDQSDRVLSQHQVVFHEGRTFDFDDQSDRFVTVFQIAAGNVILLDRTRRVRSTLTHDALIELAAATRELVKKQANAADLGIDIQIAQSDSGDVLTTSFGDFNYVVQTRRISDRLIPIQYSQFVDWAGRLDLARGTSPPPFGRMELNQRIGMDGRIPVETKVHLQRGDQQRTLTVSHQLIPELGPQQLDKINEAAGMLTLYREVSLKEFQQSL